MHYLILTVYWVSLPYTLANNIEPNISLVHGMKPFISHQIFSERFFRRLTCNMKSSPITNFLHFIPLKGPSLILGMAQCLKENSDLHPKNIISSITPIPLLLFFLNQSHSYPSSSNLGHRLSFLDLLPSLCFIAILL